MTNFYKYNTHTRRCKPIKGFSLLFLLCAVLFINGCNAFKISKVDDDDDKKIVLEDGQVLTEDDLFVNEKKPRELFNPKNLFGKNLRSDGERLDRLERAVQDMRNEFDSTKPSIKRLVDLEGDIQRLVRELKQLNQEDLGMAPPSIQQQSSTYTPPAKAQKPYAPPENYVAPNKQTYQNKSPPAMQGGKADVYDIRIGEHPGRTRIVMDVNSKTSFRADVDNNEKIMVVDLPQAGWTTTKSKTIGKSGFVSSYKVEASGNGHILIIQLKRNAKISYKDDLQGTLGNSRRLVIDLVGG